MGMRPDSFAFCPWNSPTADLYPVSDGRAGTSLYFSTRAISCAASRSALEADCVPAACRILVESAGMDRLFLYGTVHFTEDDVTHTITMERPWSTDGIWVVRQIDPPIAINIAE